MQTLTVQAKIASDNSETEALARTVHAFAAACRHIVLATPDRLTNETRLRALTYRTIRDRFALSANLAQQAIRRVITNRKAAKGTVADYRGGSVQYDERTFCLYGEEASLTLIGGRRRVPLLLGECQREQLSRHAGERRIRSAQLVMRRLCGRSIFSLNIQIEVPCATEIEPVDRIGGDMGRTDILHTSNARTWSGNLRKTIRDRHHRVRRSLQIKASKGTRSTRRRCRVDLAPAVGPTKTLLGGREPRDLSLHRPGCSRNNEWY